eukprot:7374557-Pyramimonas_sp.AAC.1
MMPLTGIDECRCLQPSDGRARDARRAAIFAPPRGDPGEGPLRGAGRDDRVLFAPPRGLKWDLAILGGLRS